MSDERPEDAAEGLFYLGAGPVAAIFLGMALVPLRGLTSASNFTFVFLAVTIVVAEFGGRWAAVATALASALSLDFFLTEPYLRLTIDDKHDAIAFVGLAACGLVAAALATPRNAQLRAQAAAGEQLALLRGALDEWRESEPAEARLTNLLREACDALPVAAIVLRDRRGCVLAASGAADTLRAVPATVLAPGSVTVPDAGGRIEVRGHDQGLGWLDVWGCGAPAGPESWRLLDDLALLLALRLAASVSSKD